MSAFPQPLVVLVADSNMKALVEGLLQHPEALGLRISKEDVEFIVHPFRDPAVYRRASEMLRPYLRSCQYALVMLDREGSGTGERTGKRKGKRKSTRELQEKARKLLERNGWKDRCEVIIIDPELDMWVWNGSPAVAPLLQISPEEWHAKCQQKPEQPKESLEALLKARRIKRSSSLYKNIAIAVAKRDPRTLWNCTDPAFQCLRETLQKWFGEKEPSETGG
jgi:hypothetical protein